MKLLIKYYFKQQSKLLIIILFILSLVSVLTITMKQKITWSYFTMLYCILPVVFTANVFSKEIECKTEFLIFTSRTPKYKILFQKFIYNWIMMEGLISILYLIAYATKLEPSLKRLLAIYIYSTILSLIGLIAALVSKKSLIGYGIPIGIWTGNILAGIRWSQDNSLVSVIVNIFLDTTIWSNLMFLSSLILPFFVACLFIVSKGEKGRKDIILLGSICSFIIISLNLFMYTSRLKCYEFWKGNEWKSLSNEGIELKYKGFLAEDANKIGNLVNEQANVYNDLFNSKICYNKVYLWFGKDDEVVVSNRKNEYKINTNYLLDFESIGVGGKDWPLEVSRTMLEPVLKSIKDYRLREQWIAYLFEMYAFPELKSKYGQQVWSKDYDSYDIHNRDNCIKTWEGLVDKKEFKKHDAFEIGKVILYELDKMNHENMTKVLKEISNSSYEMSNEEIYKICIKYYDKNYVNKLFGNYEKVISKGSRILEYQIMN